MKLVAVCGTELSVLGLVLIRIWMFQGANSLLSLAAEHSLSKREVGSSNLPVGFLGAFEPSRRWGRSEAGITAAERGGAGKE